jgi:tetratricopeptide (TPR) repeat protein
VAENAEAFTSSKKDQPLTKVATPISGRKSNNQNNNKGLFASSSSRSMKKETYLFLAKSSTVSLDDCIEVPGRHCDDDDNTDCRSDQCVAGNGNDTDTAASLPSRRTPDSPNRWSDLVVQTARSSLSLFTSSSKATNKTQSSSSIKKVSSSSLSSPSQKSTSSKASLGSTGAVHNKPFKHRAEYDEGMDFFQNPLHLAASSKTMDSTILFNLGRVHHDQGSHDDALTLYQRSLRALDQNHSHAQEKDLALARYNIFAETMSSLSVLIQHV